MTDDPPVWLLDVDGVINATKPGWGGPPRKAVVSTDGHPWTLRWEPKLTACIRTLHMAALVEVMWCTTWCPHAAELERLWHLPTFGRAWTGGVHGIAVAETKLDTARKVLADGRRLIWTDDMETPIPGHPLYDELTSDGRALLIRPSSRRGLRPEDMHEIETWARRDTLCDSTPS